MSISSAHATDITQTDLVSYRAQIHSNGEHLALVWTERSETNSEVYFSQSDDFGSSFSEPMNLSNNSGHSAFPRLAAHENNIFVTWYDYTPGQSDIFFSKSSDYGETFENFNISDSASASYNPWIASNSEFTYLVWNDGGISQKMEVNGKIKIVDILLGASDIMFGLSKNSGETFEIKNISNQSGESINPRMRVDGDNVYVVWTNYMENSEIFFSKSNDSGLTFSSPTNISRTDTDSFDSGIQIYQENIFLIWKEKHSNGTEIYFSKSSDGGNTFDSPASISGEFGNYKITRDTQMSVSYPHLYLVYYDEQNSDVHLAHSPNMGSTFYDSVNLSLNAGISFYPQLVTSENKVLIVWSDDSDGDNDVYLRESHDFGHTFGPISNLSDDNSDSLLFILGPQISKSENSVNVIWENKTESQSNLVLKHLPTNDLPTSFSRSFGDIQVSLEGFEIQPQKETHIGLKFVGLQRDVNIQANHTLIVLDSKNKTVFQSTATLPVSGLANHTVTFPEPGQYSLKLNTNNSTGPENTEMIITVIPEFEFGIFLILSLSFSIAVFTKRIHPKMFR